MGPGTTAVLEIRSEPPPPSILAEDEGGDDAGGDGEQHGDHAVERRVVVREEVDVGAQARLAHDQRRGLRMHHAAVLQHEHLDVVKSGRDVGREVQPRAEKLAPEEGDLLPFGGEEALASLVADERLARSEEHTSELQSLMRISYAVFCLKTKKNN